MTASYSPGEVIAGKYRIERTLGKGGMGVVVLAMHEDLDQRVAIKFLTPEAVGEKEWMARFQREARAAAKIKSEHVVRVFDVGKLESGAPYMVMEYLEGQDLSSILNDRTRIPVADAVRYVLQACEALAEAHALDIVHRDLKPANLFVTKRADGSPSVKVLDFGISKMTVAGEVSMTSTSAIVGSPLYMSPEQMKASRNVDLRSDIWSLGVILHELVAGTPPFEADTTAELCALVLTSPPKPLRAALATAPEALEHVIRKCLMREPEKRYQSVGELAVALAPFAPDGAMSIERIGKISGTGPKLAPAPQQPAAPMPESLVATQVSPHEPPAASVRVSGDALSRTEMVDPTIPTAVPAPTIRSGAEPVRTNPGTATAAAWGAASEPPKRRIPWPVFAGGIGAVLAAGVVVIVFALPKSPAPSTRPDPTAPPLPSATALTAATPSSASVSATPPASSSATPSIAVTALPASTTATTPTTKPAATNVTAQARDAGAPPSKATATATGKSPPAVNTAGFGGRQ